MLVLALCLGVFSIFIVLIVKFLYWKVQCWFCGYTTRASWSRKTSFVCQQCGQYNGFKSDGDYNKVIPSQYIAELNPVNFHQVRGTFSSHSDVLCPDCTRNQNIIIQKLSEYNPKDDKSDEEIKEYTRQLELKYSLCSGCYQKVNVKLRQLDCKLLPSFIEWWHNHNSNNKHRTMSTMKNPTSLKTTHRPQGLTAWFELFVILRIISILCFVSIITGPFLTEITKQTCLIQIPTNQSHLYKFIELFWSNHCRHYSRQYCPLMIIYAQHFSLSITGQMWFTCLLFCLQFLIIIRTGWRIRSQQQQPYYSRCRRRDHHYSMYHDGLKSLILLYDISMLLISINILLPSILTMDSKLMKLILSNNSFIIHVACFSVILIFLLFIVIAYGTKIWLSFFLKDFLSQQKQLKTKWPIHTTTNTTTTNNSSNDITFTNSRSINDGDDDGNTMSYYSTPSNCQSLNSSRKSLEDQLAATKLYTTSNYSNQTVFRPSVLTTNHHHHSQTSSPPSISSGSSIIDSRRYSTTHSPHSFISSNHFNYNNNNRMKQHQQNMQLESYPFNEEDTLSVFSCTNNQCKLKHDPTMDYHADQCHHHHHHPVSDDYSFMHSLSEVAAAKRKSSHSSLKRKRRTGLIHFILCLLFGRLETWKDVCYELTCLANAIFLSIIIYCTCRIMFCFMNTFGI